MMPIMTRAFPTQQEILGREKAILGQAVCSTVEGWPLENYRDHTEPSRPGDPEQFWWTTAEGAQVALFRGPGERDYSLLVDWGCGPHEDAGKMTGYVAWLWVADGVLTSYRPSTVTRSAPEGDAPDMVVAWRNLDPVPSATDVRVGPQSNLADQPTDGEEAPNGRYYGGDEPLIRESGGEEILFVRRLAPARPPADVVPYARDMSRRAQWNLPDASPAGGARPSPPDRAGVAHTNPGSRPRRLAG